MGAGGPSSLQVSLHPSPPKQEPKGAMSALLHPLVIFDGTMAGHLPRTEPIRISVPGVGPGKMARVRSEFRRSGMPYAWASREGKGSKREVRGGVNLWFGTPVPILVGIVGAGGIS